MDSLEILVRDSLTAQEERAPDAGGLLTAVRGGVVRRRRLRVGAACAAVALVGVVVGVVLHTPGAPPQLHEFSGHYPPTQVRTPVPVEVSDAAGQLSRGFAAHPPATVVWVATTLNAWYALEGQPALAVDRPVYVVELRGVAPMQCRWCKAIPIVTGRFGISVLVIGGGDGGESVVTDIDYPLDRLGTVKVVGYDY